MREKKPHIPLEQLIKEAKDLSIDFTKEGLGAWSMSKIKVLQKCPLKFFLQYVLKYKPENPVISMVTEAGKAAHRVLEFVTNGKNLTQAYALTRKEFGHMPEEIWEQEVATLEYSIQKFSEKLEEFQKVWGIKRIFQELRIGVTKDWEPTGFFADDVYFRGVIDLAIQLSNGDLLLIDHKKGLPAICGIRNSKDQLDSYKVLFHHGIEKINGAQAGIHFIKDGEIKLDDYVDANEISIRLKNILEFTIQGAIDRLLGIGYFKHYACNICKYCEFSDVCKSGGYKTLEKETSSFFLV